MPSARPITATPISASGIAARGVETGSAAGAAAMPWLFNFNSKMTALPTALQRMNATYTRNSEKRVVQDGALVTLSANQFGTSYDPVTGLYGYMPEPAATNLATNSDGAASTYTVSNVADGTAVPGFTNGIAFGNNSVTRSAFKGIAHAAGTSYTVSVFIVMDDGGVPVVGTSNATGDFCLVSAGAIITAPATVTHTGGAVYRVSATASAPTTATNSGVIKYTGQSARTFRITGIQEETGPRATSYIATTGSTASRAADVLSVPLANIPGFTAAGYTLFADFRPDVLITTAGDALVVSDGSTNNRAWIRHSTSNTVQVSAVSNSVTTGSLVNSSALGLTRHKASYSVLANAFLGAFDGASLTADTSGAVPLNVTVLSIGVGAVASNQLNGFIFRAGLVPQALTQAQINGLTA